MSEAIGTAESKLYPAIADRQVQRQKVVRWNMLGGPILPGWPTFILGTIS